jgi:hypothetical protein
MMDSDSDLQQTHSVTAPFACEPSFWARRSGSCGAMVPDTKQAVAEHVAMNIACVLQDVANANAGAPATEILTRAIQRLNGLIAMLSKCQQHQARYWPATLPVALRSAEHEILGRPGPDTIMITYRVPETGAGSAGGDGTVQRTQAELMARGFSTFVAEQSLQGGQDWTDKIQSAIMDCTAVIALCSTTYGDTKWTKREFGLCDNLGKPILPVWHSGIFPPASLALQMSTMQRVPRGSEPLGSANFDATMDEIVAFLERHRVHPDLPPNTS